MCGIAGYHCIGEFDPRLNVALAVLGIAMQDRGKHSWGFTDGKDEVVKVKGAFADGFDGELLGRSTAMVHTRFGTVGAQTAENSHPFRIGRILGMHNGQVYNHREFAQKYDIKYEVDSELIFHQLDANRDLSEIEAYGAIVFVEGGVIHLGKFNAGQLQIVQAEWGWLWASTAEAINNSIRMSGLTDTCIREWKLEQGKLYQIWDNELVEDSRPLSFSERKPYVAAGTGGKGGKTWNWKKHCWDDNDDQSGYNEWLERRSGWFGHGHDGYTGYQLPPPSPGATFTSEPSSDYDEVIDTEDSEKKCGQCHGDLVTNHFIQINGKFLCPSCYENLGNMTASLAGLRKDDDIPTFSFDEYTADEAWMVLKDSDLLKCDDCGAWSNGDDKVYVDKSEAFAVCEECYTRNYVDVDDEFEEGEVIEHPTEQQVVDFAAQPF